MPNGESVNIKDPKISSTQYRRTVINFLDDERYKRLDEEGKKEKLNMFFDKYTSSYLEQQETEDVESYRERFLNKYLHPKKEEGPIKLPTFESEVLKPIEKKELEEFPEVSPETKSKEPEERKAEIEKFDSVEFTPLETPEIYTAERSSIPRTTVDPTLLALREEQVAKQGVDVKEAQAEIDKSDDFKYIKEKPDVFVNNIEAESKKIGRELRKKGYSKGVSREVVSGIQQKANQDLLNTEKEKLFKYKSQEEVYNEAEEVSQPYIDGWEEGTFIDPQTGMRKNQPETDEEQDYLNFRNEMLLNLTAEAQAEISKVDSVLQANKDVPFIKRILQGDKGPVRINEIGKEESHLMGWGEAEGKYIAFPTLTYKDGKWDEPKDPQETALDEGNYIAFDTEEEAVEFAAGSWKPIAEEVQKLDIDKVKALHLDAYVKKNYWDRRAEEAGAQFREETPTLGSVPRETLEFVRRKRSQANAEFEATSLMLHKNIGPKDIEKDAKFNWQIFGNAFGESLAGEVNMMDAKSIDRNILAKINEIGSTEFNWTKEEEKHIEATLLEHVAEMSGSLAPHMYNLVMMGQATSMLKAGTFVERLRKGYKILKNPVLKASGKSWKMVVAADEAVPAGYNVLKTVNPSTWGKAAGLVFSSAIDEAVFTGIGGFQLGTMTGMNMAHGIRRINYKGKWGKILSPYIDMVVKSGLGATVGMEAGSITGAAVKSLMDYDVEFREEWNNLFGDWSETGKRGLSEVLVNTIMFGGMHLVTSGTAKKLNSPVGEEMKWYGSFSPKYRMKVLEAAREAEKLGYTETARQLNQYLDVTSNMLIGEEARNKRIEEAQKTIEKLPDEHIKKATKSHEELINILEQKRKAKEFDGKIKWMEGDKTREFELKDRYELNLSLEEAYDNWNLYRAELGKRKAEGKEVQAVKMPEGLMKEIEAERKIKDEEITEAQKKLGIEEAPEISIPMEVENTLNKLDKGEPVVNERLKEASDLLYDEYKKLEVMKKSDKRVHTEEQINDMQEVLGEEIAKLNDIINEQVKTGEFKGKVEKVKLTDEIEVSQITEIGKGEAEKGVEPEVKKEHEKPEIKPEAPKGEVPPPEIRKPGIPEEKVKPEEKPKEEAINNLLKQREEEYEKVRKIEDLDERIKRATEVEEEYKEKIAAQKAEGVYTGIDTTGPKIRTEAKKEIRGKAEKPIEPKAEGEKEYKYHMTSRPFDIGTYHKEGFVRHEDDGSKFGVVVYNKPVPVKEMKHFSFAPITEIEKYNNKQITYHEDLKANIKVVKTEKGINFIEAEMLDKEGKVIDKETMSATDFLTNVEEGRYKLVEEAKGEKPIEPEGKVSAKDVDSIIDEYLDRWDEKSPEEPPLKNTVFRTMKDTEWESIQKGEISGGFWTSDPTEYGRHAQGPSGKNTNNVLVAAKFDPKDGKVYRGLVQTAEEASKAHFQSTKTKALEDIIAVYKWDGKKLSRIWTEGEKIKPPEPEVKVSAKVVEYPVEAIQTDPEKFQQRKEAYIEEHVQNIIDKWADIDLDPLRLWKNPETGEVYVLAGHHRLEAAKRKGLKNIEAKFFEGTEAEAIKYARTSNVGKARAETLTGRALFYRDMREKGASKAEIKKEAVKNEGNNSERIIDYSHLNPDGKTIEILERFEKTGEGENTENIRNVAQFIGRARRLWPGLTNAHETEMVDFMLNTTNYKNFGSMVKFQELIETARGMFFKSEDPLNLAKIREQSYEELDYENKLKEYQNKFKTAQDDFNKKKEELDRRYENQQMKLKLGKKLETGEIELTQEKRAEILKPLEAVIEKAQGDIIDFKLSEGKYKEASKQGISLWDREMEELEEGREEAGRKGDKMTEEELSKRINELVEETKEERRAKLDESDFGNKNIGEDRKTLDTKVQEMIEQNEKIREGFLVSDRVKSIMKKLGVPIAEKYLPRKYLGIYKYSPKHIKVQRMRDVFVATHEATHFISIEGGIGKRLISNTEKGAPLRKELTDIYTEFYPTASRSHKLSKRVEEGMAVLLEYYAYDPDYIIKKYPNLVDNFIKPTGEYYDKKFTMLLDEIGRLVGDYAELTPDQQIGTRIKYDIEKPDKGFNVIQKLKFEIFNQVEPLKRYSKTVDVSGTTEDPFVSYFNWMNRNTLVHNFIKGNYRTILLKDGNYELKPGTVKDVMRMVKNKEKPFDAFLISRRVVEDHNRLVELKEKLDAMDAVIEEAGGREAANEMASEFKKDYLETRKDVKRLAEIITNNKIPLQKAAYTVRRFGEEFKDATTLYDDITKDLVRFSRNTGLIKPETAEKYITGKGYAPFFRFINDELVDLNKGVKPSTSSQTNARMFKGRTGGEEDILAPSFSIMTSINEVIHKGLENKIWADVYNMSLKNAEIARRFEKINTTPFKDIKTGEIKFPQDKDPNLLKILIDGKRVYTKPAPEFLAVARNLRGQEWDLFTKILKIPSSVFTRLTTSANPIWALGNFTVDQISGFMQTKTGFKPVIDPIVGIPDMFKTGGERIMRAFKGTKGVQKLIKEGTLSENDISLFSRFLEIGGKRQVFKAQFDVSPEEALTKLKAQKTKFEKVTGVIDTGLNILELPSNLSEYMSRFAEFKRAKDKGKPDVEAMYMAAEVTVPFQLMGNWFGKGGQTWARSMPYFTAINAILYKYGRTINEQPGRVLTVNAAIIASAATTVAAVMASASNEQKRLLGNMPAREIARAIFLPCPWDDQKLLRIRVPEEVGALSGLVYLYMIQQYGGNEITFHDYIRTLTSAIPDQYNIAEPQQMVMSWLPQVVSPTVEAIANKKTYPEFSPIIPQYVIDAKPPAEQYSEYTSKMAKTVGRWLDLSPAKIDYWVKNQFGAVGKAAFMWQLPNNPMTRQEKGHVMGGRAYNHFYENKEEAKKEYNFLKEKEDYSVNEKKGLIDDYVIFSSMGRVLSNFRRTLNITKDVPEEFKEDAYQLLLRINKGEKGADVLDKIEEFNTDLLDYIKENKLDIGVEYKETRKKVEDSLIRLYRDKGLIDQKKYRR